ncbi:hypothetical protein WSM22_23890 [Cytophagales bacterium WSM2-2]|nr:hypothetical protein WSM22_23890 [Cytophagales bacterium WSM2-2]
MKSHHSLARHILDAIHRIEEYTANIGKDQFLGNFMLQDAVIRNIEIIGEASKNINVNVKQQFPQIPGEISTP